jgi:hypothetical protein
LVDDECSQCLWGSSHQVTGGRLLALPFLPIASGES